jgi:hypothetical protein
MSDGIIFLNLSTNEYILENAFVECEKKLKLLLTKLKAPILQSHWQRSDTIKIVPPKMYEFVLNTRLYERIDICSNLVKYHFLK